ncbi:MAG: two-component regulator propeller domain-containing protein, partial [Candidatus Latescibacterota bacterium]
GFFAKRDSLPNGPLYCISNAGGKIGCLASDDNGATWYDYAVSAGTFNPYAVGGCRTITDDGYIIGSFTDSQAIGKVIFIKIKAGLANAGVKKSSYNSGRLEVEFAGICGQPEKVRFGADGKTWSDWMGFAANMTASLNTEPRYYQLRSRLGVESEVFEVVPSTPKQEWKTWTRADGLRDSLFLAVAGSRDGNVWVSSQQGGVSRFDGSSWKTLTKLDGLPTDYVISLLEGADGSLWFGTYGAGAVRYDGTTMQVFNNKNGLADNFVYAMAREPGGAVWFGSHYNGVTRYDSGKFTTYSTSDGLAGNSVLAITAGLDGSVWFGFGNYGSGLSRFDGKSWKTYTVADGLVSNQVSSLAVGKDGFIWAGHYASGEHKGGVSRFDGEKWTRLTAADGLICDYISTVAVASDGAVWLGGWGGASRYDGKSFANYTVADGLAHRWVKSIGFDRTGAVWFATYGYDREGGVTRYFSGVPLIVVSAGAQPEAVAIRGNYPNPFNPDTTITFSLPRESRTEVAVYSITGQKIHTLATTHFSAGTHSLRWDGRNESGLSVASGVYLAVVNTGNTRSVHRMLLLR